MTESKNKKAKSTSDYDGFASDEEFSDEDVFEQPVINEDVEETIDNDAEYVDNRLQILRKLQLRKIVKENHGNSINQIIFNINEPHNANLVATVGYQQASIYDSENVGDNLDLICNFVNEKTPYVEGGLLTTCAWLRHETPDETYLAVAGKDKIIQIISIAHIKVIAILTGHENSIIDLVAHPTQLYVLLSASKDKTIRLWDTKNIKCLCIFETEVFSLAFHPLFNKFFY